MAPTLELSSAFGAIVKYSDVVIVQLAESNSKSGLLPAPVGRDVQLIAGGLLVVLATLVVYGPALPGDVLWDDDQYVSENRLLFVEDGLWRIWMHPGESPQYYPLVFTSFWLEARLWGLSTFGLHLVNVLLHALNALLLWSVLRRLQVPGAWLAGALFALHPVHVESVAWITERKNVLSGLFYLLSISAYLRFVDRRRVTLYVLALLLFICALLSKTATCVLPVVLLLVQWWKRPPIGKRAILAVLPFFCVGLVAGFGTILLEKHEVGAMGEPWALSGLERVLLANRALWFYVGKLLWPAKLAFNYPRWEVDATALWQYVFPALTVATAVLLWKARVWIGKGPLAALGCFVVGVAPVLGFFDVYYFRYAYVADHFQYHASMGFIALMAVVVIHIVGRLVGGRGGFAARLSHVVLLLPIIYGVLAFRQAGLYTDIETLWRRTIAQNPSSMLAHHNLALLLVRGHEDDPQAVREAEEHLHVVLRINPRCTDAHCNLGTIAGRRGRHEEAMEHYRNALSIAPADPTALYNLGRELERRGDVEGAMASYRACLKSNRYFAPAYNRLGRILLQRGARRQAWEHFQLALDADPRNTAARHNLGMIYEEEEHYAKALGCYRGALAIDPDLDESCFRIAVCLRKSGEEEAAEAAYRRTITLNPMHADALADLSAMHYAKGRFGQAAEGYRRALELHPTSTPYRVNLAAAYQQLGAYADAVAVLEAGLHDKPEDLTIMHELAKVLATAPQRSVRDGGRALELATKVVERLDPPRPEAFRTLGAAYAEVRQYAHATEAARRGLDAARTLGLPDLEEQLAEQLQEYQEQMQSPSNAP